MPPCGNVALDLIQGRSQVLAAVPPQHVHRAVGVACPCRKQNRVRARAWVFVW